MSVRDFRMPLPKGYRGYGWCKWCAAEILKPDGARNTRRMWHAECARQFNLHTRLEEQREFIIGRDGGHCWDCGEAPMRWQRGQPAVVLDWSNGRSDEPWLRELWSRDGIRAAREMEFSRLSPAERIARVRHGNWFMEGGQCSIERVSALEVDHEVPLWSVAHLPFEERRRFWGPDNLRLRCPRCHKAKTAREAGERAALRRGLAA